MSSGKPSVNYRTTVDVNECHYLFDRTVGVFSIYDCIQVLNGTLESVLHLIGYSYQQINRPLGQNVEFVVSFAEDEIPAHIKNDRPTSAQVVECDSRLYVVVVDEGMAHICGHIERVIQNDSQNSSRLKISGTGSGIITETTQSSDDEVHSRIASGQHFTSESEKGSLFVVPNDDRNGHQMNRKLTLVLKTGPEFVITGDQCLPSMSAQIMAFLKELDVDENRLFDELLDRCIAEYDDSNDNKVDNNSSADKTVATRRVTRSISLNWIVKLFRHQ